MTDSEVRAPSVTALKRWLYFAAILRSFSVYLGFFDYTKIQIGLFNKQPSEVTELYGRTFAVWTLLTCVLCLICARDPKVPAIYGATLFSFVAALLHFILELFVFGTMNAKAAAAPLTVAGISVLWMGLGWSYYTNYAARSLVSLPASESSGKTE